jgi:hypothetical protein
LVIDNHEDGFFVGPCLFDRKCSEVA